MTGPFDPTERDARSLRDLFEDALAQPEAQREQWLQTHCPDAQSLRAVRELLRADGRQDEPLSTPVGEWFLRLDEDDNLREPQSWIGQKIGDFRLHAMLGEGGMSCVYLASREQADFDQKVAVKLLKSSFFSAIEQRMFRRERQVLAALDHPNIARLIDGGVAEQGVPYLVIEYVDGMPITRYCATQNLDVRARLVLFVSICRAAEAAHRALIVHRDIKPSNVMVSRDGTVKLLDFGIAKILSDEDLVTRTVGAILTPGYAAPEQYDNGRITTATDVYALGVVLHELLIGMRPEKAPISRPSQFVRSHLPQVRMVGQSVRALQQVLVGDLDNVLMKAMQADPALRYRNAGDLGDDIERFMEGQPVQAHPPSGWYRTRKFVQRHRGAVGLTAVLLLAVLASLALALWQGREARIQAGLASAQAARATEVKQFLLDLFEAAQEILPKGERPTPDMLVKVAKQRLEGNRELDSATRVDLLLALARVSATTGDYAVGLDLLDQARALVPATNAGDVRIEIDVLRAELQRLLARLEEAEAALSPHWPRLRELTSEFAVNAYIVQSQIELDRNRIAEGLAHADSAADKAVQAFAPGSRKAIVAALLPGRARAVVGDYQAAEPLLRDGLARWKQSGLALDDDYAVTLSTLAVVNQKLGHPDVAIAQLNESIELLRAIHEKPTDALISMLENRAGMLRDAGQNAAAVAAVEEAVQAAQSAYSPEHPSVLSVQLTRATITSSALGPQAGAAAYTTVVETCNKDARHARNRDCGRAYTNFGTTLTRLGRYAEAETMYTRGLALRRELFGDKHPDVATALSGFGVLRRAQQRPREALDLFDQAVAIRAELALPRNLEWSLLQRNRVMVLRDLGEFSAALAALDEAQPVVDKYAAGDAKQRFQGQVQRAILLHALSRVDEARAAAAVARDLGYEPVTSALYPDDLKIYLRLLGSAE